jgi:hypothetical protein
VSQRVIKQHYVPQHYLKGFANSNKKNYYVCVYNKENGKKFPSNIRDIGHENYFYDISEEQNVEKRLSIIESKFSKSLKKLIKIKDLNILTSRDKEVFSNFIAIQYVRTKESRISNEQVFEDIINIIGKSSIPDFDEVKLKIDKESSRDTHVDMMFSLSEEISNVILNEMSWKLCVNRTNKPFWTSDHPCAGYNELEPEPFKGKIKI